MEIKKFETIIIFKETDDGSKSRIRRLAETYAGFLHSFTETPLYYKDVGSKKLAYPITRDGTKYEQGYYILYAYSAPKDKISEIEATLRIDNNVLKYLTTQLDDSISLKDYYTTYKEIGDNDSKIDGKETEQPDALDIMLGLSEPRTHADSPKPVHSKALEAQPLYVYLLTVSSKYGEFEPDTNNIYVHATWEGAFAQYTEEVSKAKIEMDKEPSHDKILDAPHITERMNKDVGLAETEISYISCTYWHAHIEINRRLVIGGEYK